MSWQKSTMIDEQRGCWTLCAKSQCTHCIGGRRERTIDDSDCLSRRSEPKTSCEMICWQDVLSYSRKKCVYTYILSIYMYICPGRTFFPTVKKCVSTTLAQEINSYLNIRTE